MPNFGPIELTIIMVIVVMIFGVGKLPEVFGAVGKGMKEFRRNASDGIAPESTTTATSALPAQSATPSEISTPAPEVVAH